MKRTAWAYARLGGGTAILAVLVWRLGTGPFLHGLRAVGGWSVLAVTGITAVTTVCSAWRWSVVARGLGVHLPLRAAIPAYYRSQFLNSALPGGVVGDVHRGVRHGQDTGDVGRGLRAVAWERTAGQVVQALIAAIVLLALASPVHAAMPVVLLSAVGGALCTAVVLKALSHSRPSRWAGVLRAVRADVRAGLLARRSWPAVTVASVIVVAGHTGTFLVAARAAGATTSLPRLWPLAMLVLLAMVVPLSVGGWGPREGVAAWAFGAAGLGAGQGVAAAAAYGVLALVATLPGAVVLVADGLRRHPSVETPDVYRSADRPHPWVLVRAPREGAADG